MTRIEEGYLAFDFDHRWRIFKLDAHRDYRERIGKLEGTKAVDFLAVLDETELSLIEVKDFRGHRIESKARLSKGELAVEVAQKVRDSLACMIGAHHTSTLTEHWEPFIRFLCNRQGSIKIVLWLEEDLPPPHPRLRQKAKASVETNIFKQKLTWLTSHVLVCGKDKEGLPGVQVSNLPRK